MSWAIWSLIREQDISTTSGWILTNIYAFSYRSVSGQFSERLFLRQPTLS